MDINTCLIGLGLTGNEAALYQTLSRHGEITGYECAKLTGISRSNVYIALAGLCDKGAAFVVDGTAQKYSPAPIREFCANKRRELDAAVRFLLEHMPQPAAPSGAYITVSGAGSILDKMKNMIVSCAERIYIAAESAVLAKVSGELAEVTACGRKVVLLTDCEFYLDGAILYKTAPKKGQIRLIVDSRFVLTGDIAENKPCSCLFSASDTLITLFKEAMKNEIRLLALGEVQAQKRNGL